MSRPDFARTRQCPRCQRILLMEKSTYDNHRRICGHSWVGHFINGDVTLYSRQDGTVRCYCDHPTCKRVYKSASGITAHLRRCSQTATWTRDILVSLLSSLFDSLTDFTLPLWPLISPPASRPVRPVRPPLSPYLMWQRLRLSLSRSVNCLLLSLMYVQYILSHFSFLPSHI